MLPSASSVVRVSRRRSVTMLPFVVTVDSVYVRATLPLSFVTIEASDDFCETSFFSSHDAAAKPMSASVAASDATAITFPVFFMMSFLSSGIPRLNDTIIGNLC